MSGNRDTVTAVTNVQAGKGPARGTVLLGKYHVESTLGFGGMGLVIQAHNPTIDERVAIKFLREDVQLDGEHVERFLREAKAAVRLKSEHVAKIRDVGTLEDGRPYMVMELLEGLDLGKLLIDHGSIDPPRAVDLVLQACDAIAEAHALGIVHRDIKPTNLFVTRRRDDSELLKVLDFGISKAQAGTEMSLTQTSSMLGTPAYMSPEQMRSARTVDPRSDIWALGTVLYELVEGRLPFDASNFAELCVMVSTEDPARMTKAPHLEQVIARCLAKPLEQRFQDVGDLAVQLEPFASEPGRANRQVRRILRVLGKSGPSSRDSTPIPMTRDSLQRLNASDSGIRIPGTPPPLGTRESIQRIVGVPPAPMPTLKSGGATWRSWLLLLLLFGVGIAAGLYVTSQDSDAADTDQQAVDTQQRDAATNEAIPTTPVEVDAAIVVPDASSSAGSAAPAEPSTGVGPGSGASAGSTAKPPVKKPPVRSPRVKKPPPVGAGSGSAAATPPPTKSCDPFKFPKGCDKT